MDQDQIRAEARKIAKRFLLAKPLSWGYVSDWVDEPEGHEVTVAEVDEILQAADDLLTGLAKGIVV